MTDAHVCNQTIEDAKPVEHVTNEDCTSNDSLNIELELSLNTELKIVENNNDTVQENQKLNSNNIKTNDNLDNCTYDDQNLEKVLNNKQNDKILKYIYKNIDSTTKNKTKGHPKNSLKRKKRSLLSDSENSDHRRPQRFQLNGHQTEREELAETPKNNQFIKHSDLADFNIETLHENIKPSIDILLQDKPRFPHQDKRKYSNKNYNHDDIDSNESNGNGKKEYNEETKNTKDDNNNYDEKRDISTEENLEGNRKTEPYDSIENLEDSSRERSDYDNKDASERNINESHETIDKNNKNILNSEIDKSKEDTKKYINEESNERDVSLNRESIENLPYKIDQNKKGQTNRYDIDESREYDSTKEDLGQSDEHKVRDSKIHKEREQLDDTESFEKVLPTSKDLLSSDRLKNDRNSEEDKNSNENNSESIEKFDEFEKTQGIDKAELGLNKNINNSMKEQKAEDFSYENVNDKISDIKDTSAEILPDSQTTLEKPDTLTNIKSASIVNYTNAKQVKINDDEIKPVIELNNEDNTSQSEEESKEYRERGEIEPREEYSKNNLKNAGVKDLLSTSKTLKEDVKSQFERIPEDYKHTNIESDSTEEPPSHKNNKEEGTLDILTPDNHEYDKDLNIKFSDLTIKLPEIKLPKDILAYTREEAEDDDKDQKRKSENTEEEEDDEEEEEHNENSNYEGKNKDNFNKFYSYPKDEDSSEEPPKKNKGYFNYFDSGEDLYEKFVRERFGKSGNLKSRSEKLINYEPIMKNKDLYKSVQKVLKRTNQIEKEAKDSKDPNYMWTLEYGEKL
ncbi:unnamed protein product [Danaus chrysippus]|uniref:(African queen) hypothetical protein n=1 Tax=Danaus chrysippus TaxID=151541 RepID=A0A8J2R2X4_9NEOP|nr:unnamed protein product [Danaus chrysippus]